MSKPYFLIVPGSFSAPDAYDSVANPIRAKGYEVKTLALRTTGLSPGVPRDTAFPTMYDDAAFIAKEIETLADAGREIILVSHSYGGFPATESMKGLSVGERRKEGKKGGVVRLAYMTVLLGSLGQTPADVLGATPGAFDASALPNGWLISPAITLAENCFTDMPEEEAKSWSAKFVPHSIVSFTNSLTHAGYKDVPVSYLVCEEDRVIEPKCQKLGIDLVERESGNKVDVTSINTGHVPGASAPEKVIDWLLGVASKVE